MTFKVYLMNDSCITFYESNSYTNNEIDGFIYFYDKNDRILGAVKANEVIAIIYGENDNVSVNI